MSRTGRDANGLPIPIIRQGAVQNVSFTATAAQSNAFGSNTTFVRLCATNPCYVLAGANPTVTTSNGTLIPAGTPDHLMVEPGWKLSVIRADTEDGDLNITEAAP